MGRRGVTLVEVLLAAVAGAIVLLGIGSFYVSMVNAYKQGTNQASLQRQGTMIQEELARKVLPAYRVEGGPCGGGTTNSNSLLVTLSAGIFLCFYQQADQVFECDMADLTKSTACATGTVRNLLAGAPTSLRASGLTFQPEAGGSSVSVSFQLQDSRQILVPLSFGMRVTVRN